MGAYMVWKLEIKPGFINKVKANLKKIGAKLVCFYGAHINGDTSDYYYHSFWGYAEPIEFYLRNKDYINDLWWIDLSCADCKVKRNHPTKWYSCKLEVEDCGHKLEDFEYEN